MFHDDNPRVVDHPQPEQSSARVIISGEWRLGLVMYEEWMIVDSYQRYEVSLSGHATVYDYFHDAALDFGWDS